MFLCIFTRMDIVASTGVGRHRVPLMSISAITFYRRKPFRGTHESMPLGRGDYAYLPDAPSAFVRDAQTEYAENLRQRISIQGGGSWGQLERFCASAASPQSARPLAEESFANEMDQ